MRRTAVALLVALFALSAFADRSSAAQTVSSQLKRATGHTASQLTTRPACAAVPTGEARCLAQVLTVKRTGRPASLLHAPHASVRPAALLHGPNADASSVAAPQAFTAAYLQWAYDTTWLSAYEGGNDTVAIVDAYDDPTAYSDMEHFRSSNGLSSLPQCSSSVTTSCFDEVNQNAHQNQDETQQWNIEESLDLDAVSSLCPLCKILLVEAKSDDYSGSSDLETAVQTANQSGANQISLSWGSLASPAASDPTWQPYTSITNSAILAASGDYAYQQSGSVTYPAALTNVTAVGGTSLSANTGAARGFNESTWSISTNCANGDSQCGTGSGCDTSTATPSYQQGLTTDCNGRGYNDISADADPNSGLDIYDSQYGNEGCGGNNWCIVGGTSLATPLAAAYEALTGVSGDTPAWTYTDRSLLNDIVSGSDGTCSASYTLICNARAGWDGPTGNGSLNGDVVAGGPGIGGTNVTSVGSTTANLAGGVYPNGLATNYTWDYGTSTSYTNATSSASAGTGPGVQPVTGSLTGLQQCATYHYALAASNTRGGIQGYDGSFTTTATAAPVNTAAPTITGTAQVGDTLSANAGSWSASNCSTVSYQWQRSTGPSGTWTSIGGATGTTYAPTTADQGHYVRVVVTETDAVGPGSPTPSAATAEVPSTGADNTTTTTTSTSTTTTSTGTKSTTGTGTTPTSTTVTRIVRFYRCARTCALINTHGATTYKTRKADHGRYIKVVTKVTRVAAGVAMTATSTRWVGPVTAATAGHISLGVGARVASVTTVRSGTRRALAQVRVARRRGGTLTIVAKRSKRVPTRVWAYVVKKGAVVSCTTARSLVRPATIRIRLKSGQTIKLVAVQT